LKPSAAAQTQLAAKIHPYSATTAAKGKDIAKQAPPSSAARALDSAAIPPSANIAAGAFAIPIRSQPAHAISPAAPIR
jgi:hypothetical protein